MHSETFQDLLKKAIGDRSQVQFAEIAGFSRPQLNKMLKTASHPAIKTLEKIAEASESRVNIEELLDSCGYDVNAYRDMVKEKANSSPVHERAEKEIQSLLDGFNNFRGTKWGSIKELSDYVLMLFTNEGTELEASEEAACVIDDNADYMILLTGTASIGKIMTSLYMILTYNKTLKGDIIPSKATSEGKSLKKSELLPEGVAEMVNITLPQMVFTLSSEEGMSEAEANIIRSNIAKLTGEEGNKYIGALEGIGFEIQDIPEPEMVKSFLENHKESIRKFDMEDALKYVNGDKEALMNIGDRDSGNFGWGGLCANVIRKETGLDLGFWTQYGEQDFKFENNPSCIIAYFDGVGDGQKNYNRVMDILEPYARELGAEKIGVCYFQAVFDKVKGECRYLD